MFDALAPWLLVAASGALHGLNPLAGWGAALVASPTSRPARTSPHHAMWHCLLPVAAGHLGAVALAAWLARQGRFGPALAGLSPTWLAVAGLALLAIRWAASRRRRMSVDAAPPRVNGPAPRWMPALRATALAGWSMAYAGSQAVGAGLATGMLPLCGGAGISPSDAVGPMALALGATAVHLAAMLASTGVALALTRTAGPWIARRGRAWCFLALRCFPSRRPAVELDG